MTMQNRIERIKRMKNRQHAIAYARKTLRDLRSSNYENVSKDSVIYDAAQTQARMIKDARKNFNHYEQQLIAIIQN